MQLPEAQVAVLESTSATDPKTVEELAEESGLPPDTVAGAVFGLEEVGLVDVEAVEHERFSLTDEGRAYLESGLPEVRLYRRAVEAGAGADLVPLGEVLDAADLEGAAVDIALSNFARKGYGRIADDAVSADPDVDPGEDAEAAALEAIASAVDASPAADLTDRLARRGLLERHTETERWVTLTDDGVTALMDGVDAADTVDRLTPKLLTSGEWSTVEFAEYNVAADAAPVIGGAVHPLRRMAERVKDVFIAMGFEEMEGPHADAQFWINDCLFMPQDHPARTHWDQFELDVPPIEELPADLLERVRRAHREGVGPDGDGYHSPWDEAVARQVDLRGHTTSLSMRYLSGHAIGDLEPPERFFSVEKVYRNDTLDATHLLEFFQIEGWVMAEDLSVRDLMGTFTEFYGHFGITDLQFKPHYNPYTEPSFELFGRHPRTGELIEIGNSGLFRDEVLRPLGVDCDVIAWGLALERLMMLFTGAEDIRDVHGTLVDLEYLREEEAIY